MTALEEIRAAVEAKPPFPELKPAMPVAHNAWPAAFEGWWNRKCQYYGLDPAKTFATAIEFAYLFDIDTRRPVWRVRWEPNGDKKFICFAKYEGTILVVYQQRDKNDRWAHYEAVEFRQGDWFGADQPWTNLGYFVLDAQPQMPPQNTPNTQKE